MPKRATTKHLTLLEDVEKCERELVEACLAAPEGSDLQLVINSGGGNVYSALAIASAIELRRLRVRATVLADCSSSALLIFASCTARYAAPHASFLFHPMRWSSEEQSRLSAARSWSEEFTRLNRVCEDWLVERLPIARRTLRQWTREERYVTARELFDLEIAEPVPEGEEGVIDISRPAVARTSRTTTRRRGTRAKEAAASRSTKVRRAG